MIKKFTISSNFKLPECYKYIAHGDFAKVNKTGIHHGTLFEYMQKNSCEKPIGQSTKAYSNESGVPYKLAKDDPGCDVDRKAPKAKARGC